MTDESAGAAPRLKIRPLDSTDKLNKLKLRSADAELSVFLQHRSLPYHTGNIAKTYVLYDAGQDAPCRVWGYISILLSEIRNENVKVDEIGERYIHGWPAIKIAQLAIDLKRQGEKYGAELVSYCIALVVKEIMPRAGCRFITLDANKPAIGFYERLGFKLVDTQTNRDLKTPVMFLDLQNLS